MPEPVSTFTETGDLAETRKRQKEIVNAYLLDFSKHAPVSDIPKLGLIWDSIPAHLSRENKKFIFAAIKKSARAREYENALRWLEDAGLVYKSLRAELDFLCEIDAAIVPLEAKAGINPKSKSLRAYDNQFNPAVLFRTSKLNLKADGKICNIPLYAIGMLADYIEPIA